MDLLIFTQEKLAIYRGFSVSLCSIGKYKHILVQHIRVGNSRAFWVRWGTGDSWIGSWVKGFSNTDVVWETGQIGGEQSLFR